MVAAIVVTLLAGTAIFAIQGALVGLIGANPIIVTIGAGAIQEGVIGWLSPGDITPPPGASIDFLARTIFGLPFRSVFRWARCRRCTTARSSSSPICSPISTAIMPSLKRINTPNTGCCRLGRFGPGRRSSPKTTPIRSWTSTRSIQGARRVLILRKTAWTHRSTGGVQAFLYARKNKRRLSGLGYAASNSVELAKLSRVGARS